MPWSKVVDKRSKGGKKSKTSLSTLSDGWGGHSLRELPELVSKPDSGVIAVLASGEKSFELRGAQEEVQWPDGSYSKLRELAVGQLFVFAEGSRNPARMDRRLVLQVGLKGHEAYRSHGAAVAVAREAVVPPSLVALHASRGVGISGVVPYSEEWGNALYQRVFGT